MLRRRQTGSIAVSAALLLLLGVLLLGLVTDTGVLFAERGRLATASRAAALAGAQALCDDDPEAAVRVMAQAAGARDEDVLEITRGWFDENDMRDAFADGSEFVAAGSPGFPEDAVGNAYRIRLSRVVPTLLRGGRRDGVRVSAASVAHLRNYGLISLDPGGEVRLFLDGSTGGALRGGLVHANGDVIVSGSPQIRETAWSAEGSIFEADQVITFGIFGPTVERFANVRPAALADAESQAPRLDDIRPVDATLLDELRAAADVIYTEGSSPDGVYYGVGAEQATQGRSFARTAFFDLTAIEPAGEQPTVIFYEAPDDGLSAASLRWHNPAVNTKVSPNGPVGMRGLTFVSTVPIVVKAGQPVVGLEPVGGDGRERVTVIGASDVLVPVRGLDFEGLVVRAGGDIRLEGDQPVNGAGAQRIRLIADGNVEVLHGAGDYDLDAGLACPPAVARLGSLATR